ncbi:MAG: gluconate 2-dehydrogenase subunit 3 family protein [Henriciella sp.]
MDRRKFLIAMSAALGSQLILPLQRVLSAKADIDPVNFSGGDTLFSDAERASLAVLTEIIIPTTDTPGAIEAGVPAYIEFMLAEWYEQDERVRFMVGLKQIIAYALAKDDADFADLDGARQTELVQQLHDGRVPLMQDGGRAFFEHLKQLTLTGYYTSEIGMTVERVYLPVPGYFDGHYPYENVGTLFTS